MNPLLNQREAALALRLSERTVERFRVTGAGPRFLKCGRRVLYRLEDLETWIATRVRGSTSEEAGR
jgi:DNA-binding transcriptional LysR family regulator